MPIDKNEIENMVWEKFPYSEAEKRCATERSTMNQLRQNYRQKLYKQYQAEQKYISEYVKIEPWMLQEIKPDTD